MNEHVRLGKSAYLSIAKVEVDGLGMAYVQDTIGLWGKPCDDLGEI